ncbi:LVIVD repeat-containing protein [Halostella salina]|uniref:LVIVD repeat-containing protein n=1 Tax=Halostella salina TaxID=1547897 RepID=UPI0013CEDF7B|nr:hypothetical protein [Halostella salina]
MESPDERSVLRRSVLKATGAAGLAAAVPAAASGSTATQEDGYEPIGRYDIPNAKELVMGDDGTTAYVALTDGFAVFDLSNPASPELLIEERGLQPDSENGPLGQIYDVKQDGDHMIVVGPANSGQVSGFFTVDISSPTDASIEEFYPTEFPIHNSFLHGSHAYLTAYDEGAYPMVVVDIESQEEIARWSQLEYDSAWAEVPAGRRSLHDIYVQDDRAYLAHWDSGTWVLDVSDPTNPEYITHFGDYSLSDLQGGGSQLAGFEPLGNSHYVQPNADGTMVAVGAETWDINNNGSGGPSGIDFWDISDPESPEKVSTIEPEESGNNAYQGGTWTTSHNFDWVGDRLYTSWYNGGVKLFDVSDPANPEQLSWWRMPDETSFWTAQAGVEGEFFAATSLGTGLENTDVAAVFTFPDEAGEQSDPPSLMEDGSGSGSESTTTTTTTAMDDGTTTTGMDETTTAMDDGTTADGDGSGGSDDGSGDGGSDNSSDDSDGGGMPGFGVGAALAGLGLGLRRLRRD